MNWENIEKYIKESFFDDEIKREDVYTGWEEVVDFHNEKYAAFNVKHDFYEYIHSICDEGCFYDFCRHQTENCTGETIESIKEQIIDGEDPYEDEDLDNMGFIYNWYLRNEMRSTFNGGFDFFVEILDEIEEEKLQLVATQKNGNDS